MGKYFCNLQNFILIPNLDKAEPNRTEIEAHAKAQRRKGFAKCFFLEFCMSLS